MYGIYNTCAKQFQFGIAESTKKKANEKLFKKIGKDSYKWRFEARLLPIVKGGGD
ncbi:MAG: hypothetical protein WCR54_07025 [Clostridia bacterium]